MRGVAVLSVAVLLFVRNGVRADSHPSPCEPSQLHSLPCLQAVRTLMADRDRFWFGSSYSRTCVQPASYSKPGCINSGPELMSIVTRLRESNDSSVDVIQQVLNVTYDVPAGSYESCGNTYTVEAVTHTVDPSETTPLPLWSANHRPEVTWSAEPDRLYSLIVWDAGAFFLHGVMYNINGSSLHHGQTAWNYRGPKNPEDRDQPYVFLLYEQKSEIDDSFIRDLLIAAMSTATRNFFPAGFVASLTLTGPIGVSVLTVRTDPFAAAYMKKNRIVNNCPAMLTPKFSALPLSYNVTRVQLMSSVDVSFTSPEISVSSCCQDLHFASNVRMANPMGDGHIQPVYTRFVPHVTLVPSNFFDTFYFLRAQLTLLLLDVTGELSGPPSASPSSTPLLHWQVINIREGDVMSGETTLPYRAPLPLAAGGGAGGERGGEQRVLMFLLLRQSALLPRGSDLARFTGGESCSARITDRCRFNLTSFITEHQMTIEGASWFVTSPDAYSRQQAIMQGLQEKSAACLGVSGYQNPCLSACTGGSQVTHAFFALVGLTSVLQLLLVSYMAFD